MDFPLLPRPVAAATLVAILSVTACGESEEVPDASASMEVIPTAETAANATYTGIYDEPVTLTEGEWEGEPFTPDGAARPRVGLLDELQLNADLDADGAEERYVLLWESSGGSGTNLYLARVAGDGTAGAAFVGNRVQVRALELDGSTLRMDVLRAGPDDAMCCPGELATLRWGPAAAAPELVVDETTGHFGLDTIAGEWRLALSAQEFATLLLPAAREVIEEREVRLQPDTPEFEITLALTVDGNVSGVSACNRYTGAATFTAPNELRTGPLALTMMACPEPLMRIEREYLRRLQSIYAAGFQLGAMALYWRDDESGDSGALRFER